MALPKIGNLAPAFSLKNQAGVEMALKDFKGKKNVVLYFYPKDCTSGCTVEAMEFSQLVGEFRKLGAQVI